MTVCQEASSLGLRIRLNRSFIIPSSGPQDYSAICIVICVVCTSPSLPLGTNVYHRISAPTLWCIVLPRPHIAWRNQEGAPDKAVLDPHLSFDRYVRWPLRHPPFHTKPLSSEPRSGSLYLPFHLLKGLGRFLLSREAAWIWWLQARAKWSHPCRWLHGT